MNAKRAIGIVGVMIAVMVALTGCFKLNMSVKVNNEKSVDYEVVYAIQKSVLGEKTFDEFMESNGSASGDMDIPEGATVVDYEDDKYKGKRITAVNLDPAKLAESSSSAETPFELKKEGDFYLITMGGVTGTDSSDPAAASMAKSIFDEASVKFTFPGKVVEAKGATIDGNTATFDMLAVTDTTVHAKAEASAGFAVPMWLIWTLVAVLVIAAALVLLFVLLRRRSAQPVPALAGTPPYGQPGFAPQQFAPQQPGYQQPAQPGYQQPAQPGYQQPGQQGFQPPAQPPQQPGYPQQPVQPPQQNWAGQGYTPGAQPPQAQPPAQPPVAEPRHDDGQAPPPPATPPVAGK
ncbi:LppM family (lipo)protein [Paenarthrobacter sp. NPDC092416]|uniref:LppM family (lipo)protein n=1 Tax=Paenarthrobacter sp. NPDC092416 TaxID=3364386 RepID=UPI0038232D81